MSLNQTNPASFGLNLVDDRFDHPHKRFERFKGGLSVNPFDFAKRYVNAELEVAVELHPILGGKHYHLVFCAIPYRRVGHGDKAGSLNEGLDAEGGSANRDQEFVLISDTYLVECPQQLATSLVRLVRAKEGVNLLRNICTSTFEVGLKVRSVTGEREVSIQRLRAPGREGNGVHGVIQSGSEIVNNVPGNLRESIGELLGQAKLVNDMLGFIRVRLGKNVAGVVLDKRQNFPFEFGEVILSPCEFAA
jgi:hypothetical protein